MSEIFIKLYLEEDVHVLIADLIRARGFDVITARDAGLLEKTDEEQLAYAVSQNRALVTGASQFCKNTQYRTAYLFYFTVERASCPCII